MIHIKKNIVKFDNSVLRAFEEQDTATIHEAMGRRRAMESAIKPISKGREAPLRACDYSLLHLPRLYVLSPRLIKLMQR
jgi:hypothetical protein